MAFLQSFLELSQCPQALALEFSNPSFRDLVERDWVQIMQLFAPSPYGDDKVGLLKQSQMLGYRLPAHVQVRAEFAKRLTVVCVQTVQELPTTGIREGLEDFIHRTDWNDMQQIGCMSRAREMPAMPKLRKKHSLIVLV